MTDENVLESQNKQILKHLKSGNSISGIDALNKFGCFRLPARIHDLRRQGYNIRGIMVYDGNKRYKVYSMEELLIG